jgi:hypothetical protein
MITNLQLLSTAPQWRRRSVSPQRLPSFATIPTDFYWGVDATVRYCGCNLIPLQLAGRSVGRLVGHSTTEVPEVWEVSIQKDKKTNLHLN